VIKKINSMKIKSILVVLAASAMSVFGQGSVAFQNTTISTPIRLTDGATYTNSLSTVAGEYSFYFMYGTSAASLNFTSPTFFNSTTANRIAGSANISLSVPAGVPAFFQLYAFSSSAGSHLAAANTPGMYSYVSGIIQATPTTSPLAPAPLFGTGAGTQFQGFNLMLTPVPEPSTIALGALGIGALFFARRRKV
jgi:hypothetical protein